MNNNLEPINMLINETQNNMLIEDANIPPRYIKVLLLLNKELTVKEPKIKAVSVVAINTSCPLEFKKLH